MPVVGAFSTDWSKQPVLDEDRSRITGRQEFIPNRVQMSFGGTGFYRVYMPLFEMEKHTDWTIIPSWSFRTMPDGHIQVMDVHGEHHDVDVLLTQRWMSHEGAEQMRRARACGQVTIAELDDDFWSLRKTNLAYSSTDPKNNPSFNRDHYWNMLGACDAITVSTEALRKRVERLNVPTFILRNAIDIERWPQNDPAVGFVSWIGGVQWRSYDLHQLRAVGLPGFLAEHQLQAYHGGDSDVPGVDKFWDQVGYSPEKIKTAVAKLCPIGEYPTLWGPVGISLIPLEHVAFNEAKSWLKQLESCAVGVPYIVSAGFHEQELLIDEGTAGREARNGKPSDWLDHMYDLLDPEVRRKEGAINRQVAERHDIRDRWTEWDSAYRQIVALDS